MAEEALQSAMLSLWGFAGCTTLPASCVTKVGSAQLVMGWHEVTACTAHVTRWKRNVHSEWHAGRGTPRPVMYNCLSMVRRVRAV